MSPTILGIIAFICWGTSDFLIFTLANRINPWIGLLGMNLYGVAGLAIFIILNEPLQHLSLQVVINLLVGSASYCLAWYCYFRALGMGYLSIISPVSASFGIVSVLVGLVLFGDPLTRLQFFAIAVAVIGIILVSIGRPSESSLRSLKPTTAGIPYALAAMVAWGILPVFWRPAVNEIGAIYVVFLTKVFVVFVFVLMVWRIPITILKSKSHFLLLCAGCTDVVALVTFNLGVTQNTALVAPIATSYSALSVLLGFLILKDRPKLHQIIGIGLIITAIATLSA